jgi:hypothetical protein
MTEISTEQKAFSRRLQQCLRNGHYSPDSGTALMREFNIRYAGQPITVHAARKWLVGEAIPTQEKMRALAQWFHVPVEWLRYGEQQQLQGFGTLNAFRSADLQLLADLRRLDENDRHLVRKVVDVMIRINLQK